MFGHEQDNQVLIDWAETRGNKQDDDRGVYVLNVSEEVEEAVFKAHFEQHGTIEKVWPTRLEEGKGCMSPIYTHMKGHGPDLWDILYVGW